MTEHHLAELRVEASGFKVELRRESPVATHVVEVPATASPPRAVGRAEVKVPDGCSGIVRLFAPDGVPLVAVGERIMPEKLVATVERPVGTDAGVAVDEILAGVFGVVRKIAVSDGEQVGPGMTLLEVEASRPAPLPPGGPAAFGNVV
jgi:biotin carboxyl carrier protein